MPRRDVRVLNFRGTNILEQIAGLEPQIIERIEPVVLRQMGIHAGHFEEVRRGLWAVASEEGGTAYYRRSKKVSMGGKTGTAQVIRLGANRLKADEMKYFSRDHAWFAAYAPSEKPEVVVVVLNEHSGHGSSQAAPIAVSVIDKFFELKAQRAAFLEESL